MAYKGVVTKTNAKRWEGRNGVIFLQSFQIDSSNLWFRTGTESIVEEGWTVSFEADGKNNVDKDSLQVVSKSAPAPAKSSGGGKDGYWEEKQKHDREVVEPRITFASSQRDAIELVTAALANDCLSFGNTAKGAKLDLLLKYVDEVTAVFYQQRMNAAETGDTLMQVYCLPQTKAEAAEQEEDGYDD